MHFVIAFLIIAAIVAVPVFWVVMFASAMGGQRNAPIWQPLVAIVVIAFVGALLFGGIWALLAPLFGW